MPSSELPSSKLPDYGELDRLDGIIPTSKKPEMPRSIVNRDIEEILREQEKEDERVRNKKPPYIQ
jgi:hypothetical protein